MPIAIVNKASANPVARTANATTQAGLSRGLTRFPATSYGGAVASISVVFFDGFESSGSRAREYALLLSLCFCFRDALKWQKGCDIRALQQ
jgi:hypothetical protein